MSATPYHNAARLNKAESLAVLDLTYGRALSTATSLDQNDHNDPNNAAPRKAGRGPGQDDAAPIALDLSIRRSRLVLLTAVTVAAIAVSTVYFNRGVQLSTIKASDKNATQQSALLDDYNSYTGNVASAFGKPIEMFVTIAAQIVVLRFMIASMLKPELGWKVGITTLALSAGMGYLISNGFNALNVQLKPLDIEAKISANDLAYEAAETVSAEAAADPFAWIRTTSEATPRNPLNNTILRNVVNTRVQKADPLCDWMTSLDTGFGTIQDTTMDFGFTPRDWQKRLLQEALEPKTLRLVANATDKAANKNVAAADLPMNASLAADIVTYGVAIVEWLFDDSGNVVSLTKAMVDTNGDAENKTVEGPTAQVAGLLPPATQKASELEQRSWLLKKVGPVIATAADAVGSLVVSDISTEFSHVDISDTIKFDAVTFELEVQPELLSNLTNSGRKTQIYQPSQCGPWPALCLFEKTPLFQNTQTLAYDVPVQVGALSMCADANGVETFQGSFSRGQGSTECKYRSKNAMLVVSIGKRLVADSLQQNAAFVAGGNVAKNNSVVAKNLRKIFSVTVGRLAWQLTDLADEFAAECQLAPNGCEGLHLPLAAADVAASNATQRLVVGRDALPTTTLSPLSNMFSFRPRTLPLVQINELQRMKAAPLYHTVAGDALLRHNIKAIEWQKKIINNTAFVETMESQEQTCNSFVEDRLYLTVKNHMYMEHSLQPAYTAATFFLFQNAVVKDAITVKGGKASLAFAENEQLIAVWASIPDRNAWLTLGGCAVLVLSLSAVVLASLCRSGKRASLADVTDPHVIARVMLDENQFPPLVLHRRVVGGDDAADKPHPLDAFVIDGLSLQRQDELERGKTPAGK